MGYEEDGSEPLRARVSGLDACESCEVGSSDVYPSCLDFPGKVRVRCPRIENFVVTDQKCRRCERICGPCDWAEDVRTCLALYNLVPLCSMPFMDKTVCDWWDCGLAPCRYLMEALAR